VTSFTTLDFLTTKTNLCWFLSPALTSFTRLCFRTAKTKLRCPARRVADHDAHYSHTGTHFTFLPTPYVFFICFCLLPNILLTIVKKIPSIKFLVSVLLVVVLEDDILGMGRGARQTQAPLLSAQLQYQLDSGSKGRRRVAQ